VLTKEYNFEFQAQDTFSFWWFGFGTECCGFVQAVDSFDENEGRIRVRTDVFGFWHLDC